VTDTRTVTASYNSATWSGGTLSAGQIATLTAGFTVDNNSCDYAVANAAVQFLGAGETITLSFDVTVTDDNGTVNDSAVQDVTFTITGTNDAPVLSDTSDPTAVLEAVNASAQDLNAITGSFSVTDLDVGDTLSANVVGGPTVLLGGNPVVLPAGAAALTAAAAFILNPTSPARPAARSPSATATIRVRRTSTSCAPARA
jgi:VCBS repeat-containing protein